MKKYALLGIDLQKDFCEGGALPVTGANDDCKRIAKFIRANGKNLNLIALTLDFHHSIHIAVPSFWKDKDGYHPNPFSVISAQDIRDGKWVAQYNPRWAVTYLEELEKVGKVNMIWNPHCIMGSTGASLNDDISDAVNDYEVETSRPFYLFMKGTNPFTENFSVFAPAVKVPGNPETELQQHILTQLNRNDVLFLLGEAKDCCLASSLEHITFYTPDLVKKIILLEDCTSAIDNTSKFMADVFDNAIKLGMQIKKSTDSDLFV
jgi:nicotinamidase-related amidase